jgi:hypothetical protein
MQSKNFAAGQQRSITEQAYSQDAIAGLLGLGSLE